MIESYFGLVDAAKGIISNEFRMYLRVLYAVCVLGFLSALMAAAILPVYPSVANGCVIVAAAAWVFLAFSYIGRGVFKNNDISIVWGALCGLTAFGIVASAIFHRWTGTVLMVNFVLMAITAGRITIPALRTYCHVLAAAYLTWAVSRKRKLAAGPHH